MDRNVPFFYQVEGNNTLTSIREDEDGYLLISFTDDTDDALSEQQTIKIHPVDIGKLANVVNYAASNLVHK